MYYYSVLLQCTITVFYYSVLLQFIITRVASHIQVHLAGSEMEDMKKLALAANWLWLCHGPQHVAAVQDLDVEEAVAAVSSRPKGKQFFNKKKVTEGKPQQPKGNKSWVKSLFWKHAHFGANAHCP